MDSMGEAQSWALGRKLWHGGLELLGAGWWGLQGPSTGPIAVHGVGYLLSNVEGLP